MEESRADWGKKEWRAYALMLEKAHQHALDGWAASVDELEQHSRLLREYMELATRLRADAETPVDAGDKEPAPPRKGRGRPRREPSLAGVGILEIFEGMKAAYMAEHPGSSPSDHQVIEWNIEKDLVNRGMRASRVKEKKVQAGIKTMRNQISDLRNPVFPKKSR